MAPPNLLVSQQQNNTVLSATIDLTSVRPMGGNLANWSVFSDEDSHIFEVKHSASKRRQIH